MKNDAKRALGLSFLALIAIAAVVLGIRVAGLVNLTSEEARTTPTPTPPARNMMQVTLNPDAATAPPVLRSGSQGEEVWQLQTRLQELGYYTTAVDGQFGQGTKTAVMAFQRVNGLEVDGIVGEGTKATLYAASAIPRPTDAPTREPTPVPDVIPAWVRSDGMPMLVNRDNPMPGGYQPQDLVDMSAYCGTGLVKIKYEGTQAERTAVDALMTMLRAASNQGITVWQVSAAYRSEAYQQQLFDEQVDSYISQNGLSRAEAISATRLTVMEPGYSEHHTGLAFDITVPGVAFKGTEQAAWLEENCWQYGFILRYTADKEDITGILAEPWHIRYVGTEHSIPMQQQNLCLEEYIARYGSK